MANSRGPAPFDGFVTTLFGMIDGDEDGRLTRTEYDKWVEVSRNSPGMDSQFERFDLDRDGYLTIEEFTQLFYGFWTDFDAQSPAEGWLGL